MKRYLLLMRHAKSTPATQGMTDHERPLEKKGVDDAHDAGKALREHGYEPDVVLCSDSRRTLDTWKQVKSQFDRDTEFVKSPELYESDVAAYQAVLLDKAEDAKCVLVIGHNPTIEDFVATFSGERIEVKPADTVVLEVKAPTWDAALDLQGEWHLNELIKC